MRRETFEIDVAQDPPGTVRAAWDLPARDAGGCVVVLAHGAGLPHDAAFMVGIGERLAAQGLPTLRFDYPYATRMAREGRRFPPNPMPKLEAAHRRAVEVARERFAGRPLLLAGKSMGGRVSSHLAAGGEEAAGCVLLGYPLHPPKKPENLRVEHFGGLKLPCLFLQGTRDALAPLETLEAHLGAIPGPVTMHVIEGADHGFAVPKKLGRSEHEVLDELAAAIATFAAGRGQ
ncbi:MAG: alpha/beta family hydrolase [Planctomycetota bacterium]